MHEKSATIAAHLHQLALMIACDRNLRPLLMQASPPSPLVTRRRSRHVHRAAVQAQPALQPHVADERLHGQHSLSTIRLCVRPLALEAAVRSATTPLLQDQAPAVNRGPSVDNKQKAPADQKPDFQNSKRGIMASRDSSPAVARHERDCSYIR
eukprot:gnl/TRDRNA2_/TRDRNA2_155690_c1_seq1.p2 gnl/TRDRNA2_/TRDRNA2_155690_c1~~gnl/TRDRNA2_/TRDRNA2_155690_c1_seq1.p2  ORF type:complete len:153 (-),score=21.66 gnl/TRDRNA2_/TRDRNA2_155690_c1_seq1:152-610(-)